jgi:Fur family ferric uptake transcriptional regulator
MTKRTGATAVPVGGVLDRAWAARARSAFERRRSGREKLIEVLAQDDCALSADELDEALRRRYSDGPPVARATIYRTLDVLQSKKLLNRVDIGDGVSRFEIVHPGDDEHHHHHFVCERCGVLVPFDDPALERSIVDLSRRKGFAVTEHEVTLRGSCAQCGAET